MSTISNDTPSDLVPVNQLSSTLVEKMFHDWVVTNKTYYQLGQEYGYPEVYVQKISAHYRWRDRKEKILDRVRKKHEQDIIRAKAEILKTSIRVVKVASRKVKQILDQEHDGEIQIDPKTGERVLVDPFIKNPRDWKTAIEAFYLSLNDGVQKRKIDVEETKKIEITDSKAEKLLEILAQDDSNTIEIESNDVKQIDPKNE